MLRGLVLAAVIDRSGHPLPDGGTEESTYSADPSAPPSGRSTDLSITAVPGASLRYRTHVSPVTTGGGPVGDAPGRDSRCEQSGAAPTDRVTRWCRVRPSGLDPQRGARVADPRVVDVDAAVVVAVVAVCRPQQCWVPTPTAPRPTAEPPGPKGGGGPHPTPRVRGRRPDPEVTTRREASGARRVADPGHLQTGQQLQPQERGSTEQPGCLTAPRNTGPAGGRPRRQQRRPQPKATTRRRPTTKPPGPKGGGEPPHTRQGSRAEGRTRRKHSAAEGEGWVSRGVRWWVSREVGAVQRWSAERRA